MNGNERRVDVINGSPDVKVCSEKKTLSNFTSEFVELAGKKKIYDRVHLQFVHFQFVCDGDWPNFVNGKQRRVDVIDESPDHVKV